MDIRITAFIERFRAKKPNQKEGNVPAYVHWKIILFSCTTFLIAVFAFAVLLFLSINDGSGIAGGNIPTRAETLKKADVDRVLSEYAEKKKRFEDLLVSPPSFVDPAQ